MLRNYDILNHGFIVMKISSNLIHRRSLRTDRLTETLTDSSRLFIIFNDLSKGNFALIISPTYVSAIYTYYIVCHLDHINRIHYARSSIFVFTCQPYWLSNQRSLIWLKIGIRIIAQTFKRKSYIFNLYFIYKTTVQKCCIMISVCLNGLIDE